MYASFNCFDPLHPSQHSVSSHTGTGLPLGLSGVNQYYADDQVLND